MEISDVPFSGLSPFLALSADEARRLGGLADAEGVRLRLAFRHQAVVFSRDPDRAAPNRWSCPRSPRSALASLRIGAVELTQPPSPSAAATSSGATGRLAQRAVIFARCFNGMSLAPRTPQKAASKPTSPCLR